MTSVWITDALLSFICFSTAVSLWRLNTAPTRLASVALGLLSLAAMIGTLRFAFFFTDESWLQSHQLASRLFGVVGLYVLIYVWLDVGGLLRIRQPLSWAHVADGLLIFFVAQWFNVLEITQLIIGLIMATAAIATAIRYARHQQPATALILGSLTLIFILNGLVITGDLTPLFGPILRIDLFHIVLALWAFGIGKILQQARLELKGWTLP